MKKNTKFKEKLKYYLMDYNGKIIHFREGKYYSNEIDDINYEYIVKVEVEYSYSEFNVEDNYIFLKKYPEFDCYIENISKAKLIYNTETRAFSFYTENKKYLCFENDTLSFSRDKANLWESFLLINDDFIDRINHILNNNWLSKRNRQIVNGKNITFRNDFLMKIGDFSVDMRNQRARDFGKYNLTVFHDAWKLEEFLLYNPLIYITAYSSKSVLEQLKICVDALRELSGFDGQIIVMSDQSSTSIHELCGRKNATSIDVDPMYPKDFVGYVCSKFSLLNKKCYDGYQPIMYLDPDIVFNCDVNQMLQEATLVEDICAPLEDFNRIQTHVPIGSGLLQLDSLNPSPYAAGFNGGTIVYPNIENTKVQAFLETSRRTITNIGKLFGRDFNAWADQEVINYISIKEFNINTSCLSKYAKYVDHNPGNNEEFKGFVHFWGHPSQKKSEKMMEYLKKIKEIRKLKIQ